MNESDKNSANLIAFRILFWLNEDVFDEIWAKKSAINVESYAYV